MRTRLGRRRVTSRQATVDVAPTIAAPEAAPWTPPPPSSTCRAPSVAMQFGVVGVVNACCQNGQFNYGDVRTHTLREIWDGAPRRLMAEALADGIYPPGCEGCGAEHAVGNRMTTPAQGFDRFPDGPHEWPLQMEFTLSNRCNLECVQCNGLNSSTVRARREHLPPLVSPYGESFFRQLEPFLEHLQVVAFLGGEPFLAPEARRIWDMLIERDLHPEVQVTTNATIWNERVEHYANTLRMAFAVSIDGATAETYESIRIGASYERVVANRDRMIAACRSYGSQFHLNYCLMVQNWFEVGQFLEQADEVGVIANVIPVFDPVPNSLFRLPAAEIDEVVGRLEEEGAARRDRLGINGPIWDHTLAMLRSHADRLGSESSSDRLRAALRVEQQERLGAVARRGLDEVPVVLSRSGATGDDRLASVAADLRDWAGVEPVRATLAGSVVVDVDAPRWADVLDPREWIGAHETRVRDGALLPGGGRRIARLDLGPGVVRTDSTFHGPDGPVAVRSVVVRDADRLLVVARPTPELAGVDAPEVAAALEELRRWSGREAVEVVAPDGVVAGVEAPDWAAELRAPAWVGSRVGELADAVGFADTTSVDEVAPGAVLVAATGVTAAGPARCRYLDVVGAGRWYLAVQPLLVLDDEETRSAIDELREWSGREPIRVTSHGSLVAEVSEPAWAAEMGIDAGAWVGEPLLAIQRLVSESLGAAEVDRVEEVAPGVVLSLSTVRTGSGDVPFRSVFVQRAGTLLLAAGPGPGAS